MALKVQNPLEDGASVSKRDVPNVRVALCKQKVYEYELPRNLSWLPNQRYLDIGRIFGQSDKTYPFLRNTNQYSGADILYFRLCNSGCRTQDPQEADLFYMPIMGHMPLCGKSQAWGLGPWACHDPHIPQRKLYDDHWTDKQCDETRAHFGYNDMLALLPHFNKDTAHKHFVVLSNEHYLFRPCTGWFAEPEGLFAKAMRVSTTSILPENMHEAMGYMSWGSEEFFNSAKYPKLYSLSPPSSVHWIGNRPPWDKHAKRPILMKFMGSFSTGDASIRRKIVDQCDSYNDPYICSAYKTNRLSISTDKLAEAMNSTFCLQPARDSPSRKSIVDVIALGCIPVFFHPAQAKLYEINWDGWSAYVSIPRGEFLDGGIDLYQHLAAIPKDEVQSMQERLYKNAHKFQYYVGDNGEDQLSNLLAYLQRKSVP